MDNSSAYTPPTLTVDAVVFRLYGASLEALLIERSREPFKGAWALPGGYSAAGQTTRSSLANVLLRKTGVDIDKDLLYLDQLCAVDTVARDPRGHAVSVVYYGCGRQIEPVGGSERAAFYGVDTLPELAYDHQGIIATAHTRLKQAIQQTTIIQSLLPETFTLTQLQSAYEIILGQNLDKRNFRKKFLSLDAIRETGDVWREGAHRPAKLYTFIAPRITEIQHVFA